MDRLMRSVYTIIGAVMCMVMGMGVQAYNRQDPWVVLVGNNKPLVYADSTGGLKGVYPELMKEIFKNSGMDFVLKVDSMDEMIGERFDVAVVPYYIKNKISPQKYEARVLYTSTYGAITKGDLGVKAIADLTKWRVMVPNKDYFLRVMHALNQPVDSLMVEEYGSVKRACHELTNDRVDVVLADYRVLAWWSKQQAMVHRKVSELRGMPYIYYLMTAKNKACAGLADRLIGNIQRLRENGRVEKIYDEVLGDSYEGRYNKAIHKLIVAMVCWIALVAAMVWMVIRFVKLRRRERKIFNEFVDVLMNLPHGIAIFREGEEKPLYHNEMYDSYKKQREENKVLYLAENKTSFEYGYRPYVLLVQKDVTSLELVRRRANRSMKLKRRFLANTTLDLKRPLKEIVHFAELIVNEPKEEMLRDYAEQVEKHTHTLLHLIDGVLDLSQLQTDAAKNRKKQVFDLGEAVTFLSEEFPKHLTEVHGLEKVDVVVVSSFDHLVSNVDPKRVLKVLSDLVEHACRSSYDGRVMVTFHFDVDKEEVTIEIVYVGRGLSEVDKKMLFEDPGMHTFAISSSYVLALNIARTIMRHVGGDLVVDADGDKTMLKIVSQTNQEVSYHFP